jgi:hypothetical protein
MTFAHTVALEACAGRENTEREQERRPIGLESGRFSAPCLFAAGISVKRALCAERGLPPLVKRHLDRCRHMMAHTGMRFFFVFGSPKQGTIRVEVAP